MLNRSARPTGRPRHVPSLDEIEEASIPIHWIIDSRAEVVSAMAEGDVSLSDAMAFLRTLTGAKVTGYRKLFDGRAGTSTMSAQELLVICVEIRSHRSLGKVGALAVVANPEQTEPFARVLGALALADRPMRLFDNPVRARSWLDAQARATSQVPLPR